MLNFISISGFIHVISNDEKSEYPILSLIISPNREQTPHALPINEKPFQDVIPPPRGPRLSLGQYPQILVQRRSADLTHTRVIGLADAAISV